VGGEGYFNTTVFNGKGGREGYFNINVHVVVVVKLR